MLINGVVVILQLILIKIKEGLSLMFERSNVYIIKLKAYQWSPFFPLEDRKYEGTAN